MFFLASCKWNQHHLPNPKDPSPSQCQHPAIRRMRRCGISKLRLITKQTRAKSSKGDKCRNKQHRECYKSKWNICNAWPNPVICMCPHIGWGVGSIPMFYTYILYTFKFPAIEQQGTVEIVWEVLPGHKSIMLPRDKGESVEKNNGNTKMEEDRDLGKEQWPTLATCCANAGLRQTNPPPNPIPPWHRKHAQWEISSFWGL